MALDFKIDVPCVVQWSLLWFSALTNLNRIFGSDLKIKESHEVVNSAIVDDIVRPFSGERTPKSCMLTSVVNVRENFTPSSSDGDDDEEQSSNG